ncbi:MAG: hypothetical protein JSS64_00635 [Bacteroidetes bacterium]|nr:hypothetical protein [Bacteroidota bacterium]
MQRVTLGVAWGGSPIWGGGYVGYNFRRESNGKWSFLGDGGGNDASVIYTSGGNVIFSIKATTNGLSSQPIGPLNQLTDADIVNNIKLRLNSTGTLSVGPEFSPLNKVHIGPAWGIGMSGSGYIGFNLERDDQSRWLYKASGTNNGAAMIWGDMDGGLNITTKYNSNNSTSGFINDADILSHRCMKIENTGKVVIGDVSSINTATKYGYKLYVEGGIITEKIRVAIKNSSDWADFVFAPDY